MNPEDEELAEAALILADEYPITVTSSLSLLPPTMTLHKPPAPDRVTIRLPSSLLLEIKLPPRDSAPGDTSGFSLWPCSLALSRYLIQTPSCIEGSATFLELGAGAAPIPSLILASTTAMTGRATDGCEDAAFQELCESNVSAHPGLTFECLRFDSVPPDYARADVVLGCEIVYDAVNVACVAKCFDGVVIKGSGGTALVAGLREGRLGAGGWERFDAAMRDEGLALDVATEISEEGMAVEGGEFVVRRYTRFF